MKSNPIKIYDKAVLTNDDWLKIITQMRKWDKTLGEGTSIVENINSWFDKTIIERIMKLGYERQLIEKDIIENPLGTFA